MRIIILKETQKPLSSRSWEVGKNITVTREFGEKLVKKKAAGEIPQSIGNVWHFKGHPSHIMAEFQKPTPVTVEEYLESTKEIKKVKEK